MMLQPLTPQLDQSRDIPFSLKTLQDALDGLSSESPDRELQAISLKDGARRAHVLLLKVTAAESHDGYFLKWLGFGIANQRLVESGGLDGKAEPLMRVGDLQQHIGSCVEPIGLRTMPMEQTDELKIVVGFQGGFDALAAEKSRAAPRFCRATDRSRIFPRAAPPVHMLRAPLPVFLPAQMLLPR